MSVRKNICLTITSLAIGGAEKQCLLLAQALQPYHDVFVAVVKPQPRHPAHLAMIAEHHIEHHFLQGHPLRRWRQLGGLLRQKKTDLVFSFLPADNLFAATAGRWAGVPVIVGGIRNDRMAAWKARILQHLHNRWLDFSISNSFSGARFFIEKGFDPQKMLVVHNGIVIRTEPRERSPQRTVTIITTGRYVPQKDYATALQAVLRLRQMCPPDVALRYWPVGFGPGEAALRSDIERLGLADCVEPIVNPADIQSLYRAADIYLCTSLFEGLSNSIMEAMAHSLPVVATTVGDNDQLVRPGTNGFLTDPGNAEALAAHLLTLVQSPDTRRDFGQASYERLQRKFSFPVFQHKYLQVVDRFF